MKAIIVDDEAVAAAALKKRIAWDKYGIHDVRCTGSMRQAIEIMENDSFDLMLCDIEMPGGSGLDLYEWVRTFSKNTECIFVSCHPEYEYVRKALIMGSMDYVLKPVDYEELSSIIERAVERINGRNGQNLIRGVSKSSGYDLSANVASGKFQSDAIQDAVDYICSNLDTNMSINDIAEVAHLNAQYFMRLFKKETGKPVLEFITECRLNRAKQILKESNMPIAEVSLTVGYDNFSYFSKLFKRYEGMTPSEYRKQADVQA